MVEHRLGTQALDLEHVRRAAARQVHRAVGLCERPVGLLRRDRADAAQRFDSSGVSAGGATSSPSFQSRNRLISSSFTSSGIGGAWT